MRKLPGFVAVFAVLSVLSVWVSVPAHAQATAREVTLDFELTVEGEPPADATFWGQYLVEGATIPLEDPDGDGVYTGSMSGGRPAEGAGFRIVQGTGTEKLMTGLYPAEPITVIKDFDAPTVEGDTKFSATVSFDEGSTTSDQYGSASIGSSGPKDPDAEAPEMLPDTGGVPLLALGVAALLFAGGGLLARESFG